MYTTIIKDLFFGCEGALISGLDNKTLLDSKGCKLPTIYFKEIKVDDNIIVAIQKETKIIDLNCNQLNSIPDYDYSIQYLFINLLSLLGVSIEMENNIINTLNLRRKDKDLFLIQPAPLFNFPLRPFLITEWREIRKMKNDCEIVTHEFIKKTVEINGLNIQNEDLSILNEYLGEKFWSIGDAFVEIQMGKYPKIMRDSNGVLDIVRNEFETTDLKVFTRELLDTTNVVSSQNISILHKLLGYNCLSDYKIVDVCSNGRIIAPIIDCSIYHKHIASLFKNNNEIFAKSKNDKIASFKLYYDSFNSIVIDENDETTIKQNLKRFHNSLFWETDKFRHFCLSKDTNFIPKVISNSISQQEYSNVVKMYFDLVGYPNY